MLVENRNKRLFYDDEYSGYFSLHTATIFSILNEHMKIFEFYLLSKFWSLDGALNVMKIKLVKIDLCKNNIFIKIVFY